MVTAVLCHCGGACKSPKAASTFVDVKIFPLLHLPFPFGSVYFKVFTSMASAAEKRAARPKKKLLQTLLTLKETQRPKVVLAKRTPKELKEPIELKSPNITDDNP